jgi:hypothetical protein
MWQVMGYLNRLEVTQVQDKAQAEAEFHKLEVARVQDKAQADVARVEDKARIYEYFVQIVATKDFEPLKAILDENARMKSENGEVGSLSRP